MENGTAVGAYATVVADNGTAVGAGAQTYLATEPILSVSSEVLRNQILNDRPSTTAIGAGAAASGEGTLALGDGSMAGGRALIGGMIDINFYSSDSPHATAVGSRSNATAADSTALGFAATASAANSVAIGSGSVADEANTVSFGSAGNERQLVHVAAGEVSATSTDAVNGSQLHATNEAVAANMSAISTNTANIAANTSAIATNTSDIATNTANIATNTSDIAALQAIEDTQTAAIAANTSAINTNSAAIATNTAAIAMNTTGVAENRAYIELNSAAIAQHAVRMDLLEGQMDVMRGQVNQHSRDISRLQEGVAMALALDSPALPSGTRFGISGGVGVFAGKSAIAMAVTAAVSEVTSVSAGFGLGTDSGEFAGRAGFQFAW